MDREIKVIGEIRLPFRIRISIIFGSSPPPLPFVLFKIFFMSLPPHHLTHIFKNDATCLKGHLNS